MYKPENYTGRSYSLGCSSLAKQINILKPNKNLRQLEEKASMTKNLEKVSTLNLHGSANNNMTIYWIERQGHLPMISDSQIQQPLINSCGLYSLLPTLVLIRIYNINVKAADMCGEYNSWYHIACLVIIEDWQKRNKLDNYQLHLNNKKKANIRLLPIKFRGISS